ncbi:MAG: hypothetical protein OEV64_04910 [Desulfobulbaceae bacterium]|nr:hypothetical protein [Desulfobulbaceae bacterium]
MITLPDGFDATTLMNDFFSIAAPFVGIAVVIATAVLILNILNNQK